MVDGYSDKVRSVLWVILNNLWLEWAAGLCGNNNYFYTVPCIATRLMDWKLYGLWPQGRWFESNLGS